MNSKTIDENEVILAKYQKINGYISILFELIIIVFSFLINLPLIIVLSFPVFVLLTTLEQRVKICPKSYSRYIYLINLIGFLSCFCFWLIPLWIPTIIITVPFIVFLFLLYLSLQLFTLNEYFEKKDILIFQHFLAVGMFIFIVYSFYDIFTTNYVTFSTEPTIVNFSTIILNILINLIWLFISFYYLYARYFRDHPYRNFTRILTMNILLIEIISYVLINLRNFYLYSIQVFWNYAIFSLLIFPFLFLGFILLNYLFGIFNKTDTINYCYYTSWTILIISAFTISFSFLGNFIILIANLLYVSILSQILSKFGTKIGKITDINFQKIKNYISLSIFIEIIALLFILFFTLFDSLISNLITRIISSAYLAFLGITLINLLVYKTGIFSRTLGNRLFDFFLLFTTFLVFYYVYLFTIYTLFVYIIPALLASLSFNLLIIRIKKRGFSQELIKILIRLNTIVTSLTLLLIPLITHLELQLPISIFTIFNLINFTLYIFFGILSILLSLSGILKLHHEKGNLISKSLLIIGFLVTFTTVFYYPYELLINTNLCITLPLFLASCYLYIPVNISLKKGFFSATRLNKIKQINSYLIFGEITILLFSLFYSLFGFIGLVDNIIISLYLTSVVITGINSILFKFKLIPNAFKLIVIEYTLIFTSCLIFFYLYRITSGTYYIYNIPSLFLGISLYIPLLYLKSKVKVLKIIKFLIQTTSVIFLGSILLFPMVISLEMASLGYTINPITTINFSLYILYVILASLYALSRKLHFRDTRKVLILKLQVIIEIIITGTTIYYYSYFLTLGTYISYVLPLLFSSLFLFIPIFFSYKRGFFHTNFLKKVLILNSILFWGCLISIPFMIGLDIYGLEIFMGIISTNLTVVVIISLFLTFLALKYFDSLFRYLKINEKVIIRIKIIEILIWLLFCGISSFGLFNTLLSSEWNHILVISCSLILFFFINLINLPLIENLKQTIFESETSRIDYYKVYKIYEFLKNVTIFGLTFSFASLLTSFIQILDIPRLLSVEYIEYLDIMVNISSFFFFVLVLLKLFDSLLKIEFERFKEVCELIFWLGLKGLILVIFGLYPFVISVFNRILLLILVFSVLSPITLSYIKNRVLIFEETQLLINKLIGLLFFSSLISVFSEILLTIAIIYPFFISNDEFLLIYISCKIVLFTYFYFSRFNNFLEIGHSFRIYLLMFYSLIFLGLLSATFPIYSPFISLISIIIILNKRARNLIFRFLSYLVISIFISIEFLGIIGYSIILPSLQCQMILFTSSLCVTLFISIISNSKRINNLEHFVLYFSLSIISLLLLYSLIPLLYNLTISVFIFLSLIGIYFHNKKDKRYKWFIKPCILLAIFDFISFMSYAVLFVNTPFSGYSNVLTLTLTMFVTGLCYVFLYNDSPELFRKISFYFILSFNTISLPVFIYFFLIAAFSLPLFDIISYPIPFTIAFNIAIALFYISLAIYQWKISWAIWRVGYRLWILLPFANYFLISEAFTGIPVFNNILNLFGININLFGFTITGSYIIGLVICSLLSLPFWYTLIKKHFNNILFIIWGLSLSLIYWFSQNAFFGNDFLVNLSFFGIAFILLLPILVRMKIWSIASILWTFFSLTMLIFLFSFLAVFGFQLLFNISISIVVGGFLFIVLSFFPNLRAQKNVILAISYLVSIVGVFLIVFNIIYLIVVQFWISLFMSLIILAFSLYSSRLLKLNKILFNILISGILIVSFTGLTYFTFNLIPNFELFSFYLALTVCGASFFVFNYYRLFIPAKRIIPLLILSIGLSLSISNLWYFMFPTLIYVLLAIFITINLFFLSFALKTRRYILWYLTPIPVTLLIIEIFYSILFFAQLFQSLILFIITSLLLYTIVFQVFLNLSSQATKNRMQVKLVNFTCFALISTYISIIITSLTPILFIYQVLEFSILWSILILMSLGYLKKSKITFELKNFEVIVSKFVSIISISLYFEIFFLILGLLSNYGTLNPLVNILIALSSFFILTTLDLAFLKRINRKFCFPINYSSYLIVSILILIILFQVIIGGIELLFLNTIIFLLMQYYSVYAVFSHLKIINRFEASLLNNRRKLVLSVLTNSIFIIIGFYVSSFLTSALTSFQPLYIGLPAVTFFSLSLSLFMFLLNNLLKYKSKIVILWIIFLVFQSSFTSFYILSLSLFDYFNLFSVLSILLINTFMLFYTCFAISKFYGDHLNVEKLHRAYSLLIVISYLEISILFFGFANFVLGLIESFLISQLVLFSITLMELGTVKRIKKKYVLILHTLCYFNISASLFIFLFSFATFNLSLLTVAIVLFCLMQFYTNISYFNTRKEFNPEKEENLVRGRLRRKNLIGASFYLTIILYIGQVLFLAGYDFLLMFFLLIILIHALAIVDRLILKFIGRYSVHLMNFSWILLLVFSIIYYSSWYRTFSFYITPVIILLFLIELSYGYVLKLTDIWSLFKENRVKFKNFIIISTYLNFTTWPIYYINLNPFNFWGLLLISNIIGLILGIIDKGVNAFKEDFRRKTVKFFFTLFGALFSIESYILLDTFTENTLYFNISVSLFAFVFFMGFIVKPFKRRRFISFLYWTVTFFLLSYIAYNAYNSGISWSILVIGLLLYPFIFMLEELKAFFDKFIENISAILKKISDSINKSFTGVYNFFKRNYKIVRLLFCIFLGLGMGILFSDLVLQILNPYHSALLAVSIFGLFYGILPSKKSEDYDEEFKQKMTRFITLWIGMTAFIFLLVLPYIQSVLLSLFLLLLSILGLGAIILIYLYRLEEKQRISILWRFWTLIIFFIILGIEIVVGFLLYFTQGAV